MEPTSISAEQLTHWADECSSINHLHTLLQRELERGSPARAADLSERARKRAWKMLNEMFNAGAAKPEGYCEPASGPWLSLVAPTKVSGRPTAAGRDRLVWGRLPRARQPARSPAL